MGQRQPRTGLFASRCFLMKNQFVLFLCPQQQKVDNSRKSTMNTMNTAGEARTAMQLFLWFGFYT